MRPDGRLPDINDGSRDYASARLAILSDIFPKNPVFRWVVSGGREGVKPAYLSTALPWSGIDIMRTGWDKDAIWALFDAGPLGRAHVHEDKLNLLIYAGGRSAIEESGRYCYDDSEVSHYVSSTRAHNTVRVDGQDQNRRKNYTWQAGDIKQLSGMTYRHEESFDFAQGEYNEGYGPAADKSVTHRRGVLFLKKPPLGLDPFFVVIDRFLSEENKPHKYDVLWHFDENPLELSLERVSSQAITLIHSGGPGGMTITRGQERPEWQGWQIGLSGVQGDYYPVHTAIHSLYGGNLRLVTLLYPCKSGTCPVLSVSAGASPEDTDILIKSEKEKFLFREEDYT
jgi:hypothetical protein